jgi:hypothetical protein
MFGSRRPRILNTLALVAGMLLAVGYSPQEVVPSSATDLLATPSAMRSSPLVMIAAGSGATPDARSDVVWLVQRMAASGGQRTDLAAFPLGFVLVERGTLVILGANGIPITELSSGRATLLPADERGSFGSANGDLVLYIQIVLVPVAAVPDTLPRGMLASDPFSAPHGATLGLELVRGIINPTRTTALPAGAMPALLLATDSAIQLETTSGTSPTSPAARRSCWRNRRLSATPFSSRRCSWSHGVSARWAQRHTARISQVSIQRSPMPGTTTGVTSSAPTPPSRPREWFYARACDNRPGARQTACTETDYARSPFWHRHLSLHRHRGQHRVARRLR